MESHLQSATRIHLDLACVKLHDTEATLNETKVELKKTAELLKETREKVDTRLFIWKIDGFNEILRQAKAGETQTIISDSFYTENRTESYGYKLKVEMHPNGYKSGKNTHLSVFIVVMKGEYDAILPWPFKKKVKFTLIDQQEDPDKRENLTGELTAFNQPHFLRPVGKDNLGWGYTQFISHNKLNSRRYIVDNTLFLQVEVGPPSS